MKKILLILTLPLFLFSCSSMEVKDFSIKIKPYKEGEGGKYWEICMSAEKSTTCHGYVGFDIYKKDGKKHYVEVGFIPSTVLSLKGGNEG